MREYDLHLNTLSLGGSGWFSKLTSEEDWGDRGIAEKYLEKYWLPELEYEEVWKAIQNNIFSNQEEGLPRMVFKKEYNLIATKGGCLFLQEDFEQLQKILIEIGEKYFVVIENTFDNKLNEPSFRMKFPVSISWKELTDGNYISSTILESVYKEFFVFGKSGSWGKYSANDYKHPLEIIGFYPKHSQIFISNIKQPESDWLEVKEWLPPDYITCVKTSFLT